ncbi:iron complex outermembrane receptor protein [Rhodovulum kholense]|uniref:Iron complex outermembrane receptor protein n=2 Tax=Rhodovulum kholense TaxID=453584 RepID=A0A8E2VK73_9RHOB|nr:iron complex outermembrane receptor protein [Rhodovulum kholense]
MQNQTRDPRPAAGGRRSSMARLMGCSALAALLPGLALAQAGRAPADAYDLEPIVIEAQSDDETSIVATEVTGGSGMATDVLDTPAAVSVITAREIRERGAASVEEVLQYTPGVVTDFYGSDDRFDFFRIRGFDAYTYRDGLSLGSAFGNVREEAYAFERVEVVKGANSTTFGVSDPGGSVNYVTKRPRQGRFGEVYGTLGSFDSRELGVDFGDDLTGDGTLSFRLTGKRREAEKEYDHSQDDETFLMGGLTWRPSAATELSFVLDYLKRDDVPGSGGHPVGTDLSRSVFLGEPDFNYRGTERSTATLSLDHDFGGGLTLGSILRYSDTESDFGYAYISGASAAGGTWASRDFFANDSDSHGLVADAHLQYDTSVGSVDSRTLVGVELSQSRAASTNWFTAAPDIDWTNPVYTGGIDLGTLAPYRDLRTDREGRAIYLQQELTFSDRVIVTAGLRHDWLDIDETNRLTGVTSSADYSETTARLGLTWKITPTLSTYASYAESVVPASIGLDPEKGEQYELGVKYRPGNGRALFTAAIYDLSKTNITRTNPATGFDDTIGEVEVRGIDLEAKLDMTRNVSLTAAYSYLDSEIVENGTRGSEGNQLSFVPRNIASLWVNYRLPGAGRRGDMTFGLGARHTGSYWFDDANSISTGSATVFDASYTYDLRKDTQLSLNVSNLFDEKHVAYGGFGADFYNPGRKISATLRRSW